MKFINSLLICLIVVSGCSKSDDSNNPADPNAFCLMHKAYTENKNSSTLQTTSTYQSSFLYDNEGRIIRENITEENSPEVSYLYEYNSNGKPLHITKLIHDKVWKRTAEYDNQGRISGYAEIDYTFSSGDVTSYGAFIYKDSKFIVAELTANRLDTIRKHIHYFENGNNIKSESYDKLGELSDLYTYEYTNIPNKEFEFDNQIILLRRNLPSKHKVFKFKIDEFNYVVSYKYEISGAGYVTKRTTTQSGAPNHLAITTYTYDCD